jgi:hypothetical protein
MFALATKVNAAKESAQAREQVADRTPPGTDLPEIRPIRQV